MNENKKDLIFNNIKERLNFYRSEIHYEISSLSQRINSFFTAQSFLVIAYSSCMANTNPSWGKWFTLFAPIILALYGVVSSISAAPDISASYRVIDHWQKKQDYLLASKPQIGVVCDDSPLFHTYPFNERSYHYALFFSKRTPWMFMILWLLLGGITAYLHYRY